ncbi:unnamed protein product [Effrenium voratum]|uniref:Uncharacterized protein n=1 Tax=Effrenium voratum TaxID=2562239 RepID=A0AA36J143_9DINO|nr:unnamed protein product [Effrenium voratum]
MAAPERDVPHIDPKESLAAFMKGMAVADPEVLRGTAAHQALSRFGQGFRRRGLFGKSWPVTKIGQFWSHSWRERRWKKTLTLMIVFNGPAALVAAHLAAILTMLLLGAGVLPPVGHPLFDGRPLHFYCQSTGFVAVVLTVLLWRPGRTIFLDRICIHQEDPKMKGKAITSMGGFLKHSEELLILFDETYTQRLWCVIELAAFLKSREGAAARANSVQIRPTYLGPAALAIFMMQVLFLFANAMLPTLDVPPVALILALAPQLTLLYLAVDLMRRVHREKHAAQTRLKTFRLQDAQCYCCTVNHTNPKTGKRINCDRDVLTGLVQSWFGSVEAFESQVRGDVLQLFSRQLGVHMFSYRFLLVMNSGILFWPMDCLAWSAALHGEIPGFSQFWIMFLPLVWILAAGPLVVVWAEFVTRLLQKQQQNLWCYRAVNVAGVLLLMLGFAVLFVFTDLPKKATPFASSRSWLEFQTYKFLFDLGILSAVAIVAWNVQTCLARINRVRQA